MNKIDNGFFSHYMGFRTVGGIANLSYRKRRINGQASVSKIRLSDGYAVHDFHELVKLVAQLGVNNSKYNLLFRGQTFDYKDKNERTIIYPRICRPAQSEDGKYKKAIYTSTIKKRWDYLNGLIKHFRGPSQFFMPNRYFDEYHMALFQHYGICHTPLIDLTQSLRVAASFALMGKETGFVYAFGLPFPQGSISHFVDIEMTMVKLQSVCPDNALRPHYQEGYLVGRLPFFPKKFGGDNLARRLIGKYLVDNKYGNFWNEDFMPIPNEALMPTVDKFRDGLKQKVSMAEEKSGLKKVE